MSLLYSKNEDLNAIIDSNNYKNETSEFIINYYKELNGDYPTIKLLKSEIKRYKRWLHQSKEHKEMLVKLQTARTYLNYMGMEFFISTMN